MATGTRTLCVFRSSCGTFCALGGLERFRLVKVGCPFSDWHRIVQFSSMMEQPIKSNTKRLLFSARDLKITRFSASLVAPALSGASLSLVTRLLPSNAATRTWQSIPHPLSRIGPPSRWMHSTNTMIGSSKNDNTAKNRLLCCWHQVPFTLD
jgi:hypothetical protein